MAKIDTQSQRDNLDKLRGRFQKLYQERMPVLKDYEKLTSNAVHSLLGETMPAMQDMYAKAKGMTDVYSGDFVPATQRYLKSAEEYDTPERRAEASGRAMADVTTAGEAARQGALERLEAYGIDPSQTRGAALDQNMRVNSALEAVKQGRDAATGVEERGRAYVSDALDKGRDLVTGATALYGTGSNMANAAIGTANQTSNLWASIYGTPRENLKDQEQLLNDTVNAKATETQLKIANKGAGGGAAAGIGAGLGAVAGGVGGYFASGGNPMGAFAGANFGSQLGSSVAGGGGGGGMSAMPFYGGYDKATTGGGATDHAWSNEYW
jgi:hypothetical protein